MLWVKLCWPTGQPADVRTLLSSGNFFNWLEKQGRNLEACLEWLGRWEGNGPACSEWSHVVWVTVRRVVSPLGATCWTGHLHESRQVPGSHPCLSCPKLCWWAAGSWSCPPACRHSPPTPARCQPRLRWLETHPPEEVPHLLKAFLGPEIPLEPCSGIRGRFSGPSSYDTFTALCSVTSCPIVN